MESYIRHLAKLIVPYSRERPLYVICFNSDKDVQEFLDRQDNVGKYAPSDYAASLPSGGEVVHLCGI